MDVVNMDPERSSGTASLDDPWVLPSFRVQLQSLSRIPVNPPGVRLFLQNANGGIGGIWGFIAP